MMYNPKISIITVCYNAATTIEQTILSVIGQKYKNIEYIIIDGKSVDGTTDIIRKYKDDISYWISESDNGIYDAMNKGVLKAQGDFIQVLGADDCLVSDRCIEDVAKYLNQYTEILSAKIYLINEKYKFQYMDDRSVGPERIVRGEMLQHPGIFVKSKIMKENLFNVNYCIAADFDFILKCVSKGVKITYAPVAVVFFSLSGVSATRWMDTAKEVFNILKQYPESKMYAKEYHEKTIALHLKKASFLEMYRKKISIKIRGFLLLEKKSLLRRGWVKHVCSNKICRWCNKDNLKQL